MSGLTEPMRHVIPLAEGVEMAFRLIPPGMFRMGSRGKDDREEPVHWVEIREGFWMAETPVTQAQFRVWTDAVGEKHENEFPGNDDNPAENMDWHQAAGFCAWITEALTGVMPPPVEGDAGVRGWVAALPTEVQWEYACRAGTEAEYYTGDGEAAQAQAGWYGEDWGSGSTHPVRLKAPNGYRLFDMHGNVWEWCADVWDANAYRKRAEPWVGEEWRLKDAGSDAEFWNDEDRAKNNPGRVLRGGSWFDSAGDCRSAYRDGDRPGRRIRGLGFRVCLVPGPPAQTEETAGSGATLDPGDGARRDDAAESEGTGGAKGWGDLRSEI